MAYWDDGWGGWGGKGGWGAMPYWTWKGKDEGDDAGAKREGPPSDNLYVKDLPPNISEEQVTRTFAAFGRVVECRVLRWDGMSACAALVRMSAQSEAEAAKAQLDGTVHESCKMPLFCFSC